MKQNNFCIVFCMLITIVFYSCNLKPKLTEYDAINIVMDGERDRLPLIIQQLNKVENITIDSMNITINDEPMEGYLYTTWEYEVITSYYPKRTKSKTKSIIIKVDNIQQDEKRKDYIVWETHWDDAYRVILFDD